MEPGRKKPRIEESRSGDRRLGVGAAIYLSAALLLFASMFLPWYGRPHSGPNTLLIDFWTNPGNTAWQALGPASIFLAAGIAMTLGAAALRLIGPNRKTRLAVGSAVCLFGVLAALLIVYRIFAPPGLTPIVTPFTAGVPMERSLQVGIFLALAAALGIAIGGARAMVENGDLPDRGTTRFRRSRSSVEYGAG